jgi:hypothetical protein
MEQGSGRSVLVTEDTYYDSHAEEGRGGGLSHSHPLQMSKFLQHVNE